VRTLGLQRGGEAAWERWLLLAAALAFVALAWLEVSCWRPGFALTDESVDLAYLQQWREGLPLGIDLMKGSLTRWAQALAISAGGPSLLPLRALTWLGLALEHWLLFRLASALLSRRAACWAVLASLACATTFLRARSLLSYALLPAELLAVLSIMDREWGRPGSLLYGACCGLLMADYEGWLFGLPIVALFWAFQDPRQRPRMTWAMGGFCLVVSCLFLPSMDLAADYLAQRRVNLPDLGWGLARALIQGARGFFWGIPQTTAVVGIKNHPMLATWSLPLLALGIWRLRDGGRILLLWLAVGLLPLLSLGGAGEPSRMAAAWPALCMVIGCGAEALMAALGRAAPWIALPLLAWGTAFEAKAYVSSMASIEATEYAPSQAMLALARSQPGTRLVAEFNYKSSAAWRFVWGCGTPARAASEIFVVNWDLQPALKGMVPALQQIPSGEGETAPYWFSQAPEAFKARLRSCDAQLRQMRGLLPRFAVRRRRDALLGVLASRPDPIVTSAVLEEALKLSNSLGELPPLLVAAALKAPLASAAAPLWLADLASAAGDGPSARRLCLRARQIDPRCQCPL
jgi:hypothetical protein